MDIPYAEVIGDPIAHSKSPLIHKFWLEKMGLRGDYRATQIVPQALPVFLEKRCSDPLWRGCNVTAPLKQLAARLGKDPYGICSRIGAANTIFRSPLGCGIAANTDIAGIAAALEDARSEKVCLIGAGGAARAALCYFETQGHSRITIIARDTAKARDLSANFGGIEEAVAFDEAARALDGASIVVNATPLGSAAGQPMHPAVLKGLGLLSAGATVFDMVYTPMDTELLREARRLGHHVADGLAMLVAQAAPAFELFFGAPAPRRHDEELRGLLTS